MKHTCSIVVVCAAIPLLADTRLDVSGLAWTVTASLAVDHNDKRIARSLKSVRLTECLTPEAAQQLVSIGAGPLTARALDVLRRQSAQLPIPAQPPLSITPLPPASAQQEMIGKMRAYVAQYLTRFPDFIAVKSVRQFHNYKLFLAIGAFPGQSIGTAPVNAHWYAAGAYSSETAYVAGRVYQKPAAGAGIRTQILPVSIGEFGGMMEEIFDTTRAATFAWDRWQMLNGARMAVFSYRVPLASSRYAVCCLTIPQPPAKPRQEQIKAGHRGLVFIDPGSGAVMRLILIADGFAGNVDSLAAAHLIEYGDIAIGTNHYLLPRRSTAYVRIGSYESREEIEYRKHRKFTGEAAINFGEDPAAQP
jgi:hypothetical protein